jgi:CheY-like chemotaxis protein
MNRIIGVVEDDPETLSLLDELLRDEGYQPQCWAEGSSAFTFIKQHQPDLVILNLWLDRPEQGWLVLDKMKADAELAETPVILISGDVASLRDQQQWLDRQPGVEALEKPFDLAVLLSMIQDMIEPERTTLVS